MIRIDKFTLDQRSLTISEDMNFKHLKLQAIYKIKKIELATEVLNSDGACYGLVV